MAIFKQGIEWKFEKERKGNRIYTTLLRGGREVGFVDGVIIESAAGRPKYFGVVDTWVEREYQREFMEAHNGLKIGNAFGAEILKFLNKEGVLYIRPAGLVWHDFVKKCISSGGIEKTPEKGLLKINFGKLPATEELAGKLRAVDAEAAAKRAAKIKRVREFAKRVFRRRPK